MMPNYLAPAGTPVTLHDLSQWFGRIILQQNNIPELINIIKTHANTKHCFFVSTGRAAMVLIINALKQINSQNNKTSVIIPGYTCYSVASSVLKAGLDCVVADIDPDTLSYDLDSLENVCNENTLAIITSSLYGMPNDMIKIEKFAKENNIHLVDDAAQCLGGKINDRSVGGFGDVGLYSFDKGKNITSIQGGVIVTNSDAIASEIRDQINSITRPAAKTVMYDFVKQIIYTLLLPPNRYWITQKLPFLGLGKTMYESDYPIEHYSNIMAGIALILIKKLKYFSDTRYYNSNEILSRLKNDMVSRIISIPDSTPVYLRLPILANNRNHQANIIQRLNKQGIGATSSYPEAIINIPELVSYFRGQAHNTPNSIDIAKRIVTLPVHAYCSDRHREIITKTLNSTI